MSPAAPVLPARRSRPAVPPITAPARPDARRRVRMSREAYERFLERSDTKFEWVDGEAIEMAGTSYEHVDLNGNLNGLLWNVLRRNRRGKVLGNDMRVRTRGGAGPDRFPDLSVVLGEPRFAPHPEDKKLVLLNPTVLFEVLSDSTAADDETGRKFEDYTATPSVTDYVLVDSRSPRVLHRARTGPDEPWAETELTAAGAVLAPPACGFSATLAEIYEGVAT